MKKTISIVLLLLVTVGMYAQDGINYKALIKDNLGAVVASQTIDVRFTIISDTGPTNVYLETHTGATTDANGIVILTIGSVITPTLGVFADIAWGGDTHSLNVAIDIERDGSFVDMGTTQFMSVPYALHAKTAAKPTYALNTFYAELGGYVIEINSDGTHGLVVAMQDQGVSNWYEANDLLSNAANHDVNGAKFKDWRLPTKRELNLMYAQRISIEGFDLTGNAPTYSAYWSSTEFDNSLAWLQSFSFGSQDGFPKDITFLVRAVRAF
jgi:hypothetical protein